MELKALLQEMIDKKASDVFIVAGLPLTYTADGRQVRMDMAPLMPADTKELVDAIYELSGRDEQIFMDGHNHDDDFSFAVPGMGRFRVNVFRQRGSLGAVIRVIPFTLPNPADYHIPDDVMACADFQKGLVLVTGPCRRRQVHDACLHHRQAEPRRARGTSSPWKTPSSTCISHEGCIVTQREIPSDVATYAEALRSAMREAPDVILLGEMRDQETIGTAMTAAEMAQLLFSTLHTTGASSTVDRIIDAFPANQQRQIRMQLSLVLQAVVSAAARAHSGWRYRAGLRDHDRHAGYPQPHPRGEDPPDRLGYRFVGRCRYAHHGSEPVSPGEGGHDFQGSGVAARHPPGSPEEALRNRRDVAFRSPFGTNRQADAAVPTGTCPCHSALSLTARRPLGRASRQLQAPVETSLTLRTTSEIRSRN